MKLEWEVAELRLRDPFKIASTDADLTRQTVLVRAGGGVGEAAPRSYYGESIKGVVNDLERCRAELESLPDDAPIESVMRRFKGGRPARCALETALWDGLGRSLGAPLWKLWGADPSEMPPTSFTIGLDDRARMLEKAEAAAEYAVLKVKLGGKNDLDVIRALRGASKKPMRVDANGGWTREEAVELCAALADLGVELVEQPVRADDIDGLRYVRERSPLPIFADESCRSAKEIPTLAGAVDGVNLKLSKCGGPTEVLTAARLARSYGMRVMTGCMIESSAGVAAMAHIAPLADHADLDGHLLIDNDPFEPMLMKNGRLILTNRPGNGLRRRQI
ncbi:MAG: dipeptide epimerase [Candidatus Poribacteria bacterium]|nr:dipeptide epimerase [Candidatus Poribacteria bacterium]